MPQCVSRVAILLLLAVAIGSTACDSSQRKHAAKSKVNDGSGTMGVGDKLPPNTPAPQTWVATLENGDKPGNGYALVVQEGQITGGKFYVIDPNHPHDLNFAGQSVPFNDLTTSGKKVTFSITLRSGCGIYHDTMTITLLETPTGEIGAITRVQVQSSKSDAASQDLIFVRHE